MLPSFFRPERDDDFGSAAEDDAECEQSPLLPIFASDLDSIAVYNMVRDIREQICATLDTTLTYEQLRTPQVSSFIVKPILSLLFEMPGRKAILYSLMANCLQFRKEAVDSPYSVGTSTTRALLCELLAIKMLKEFSPRDLIDALSYDFYPLQGPPTAPKMPVSSPAKTTSRISALEIAIRAQVASSFVGVCALLTLR